MKKSKNLFKSNIILGISCWLSVIIIIFCALMMNSYVRISYSADSFSKLKLYSDTNDVKSVFQEEYSEEKYLVDTKGGIEKVYFSVKPWQINNLCLVFFGCSHIEIKDIFIGSLWETGIQVNQEHLQNLFFFNGCIPDFSEALMRLNIEETTNNITGTNLNFLISFITQIFRRTIIWGTMFVFIEMAVLYIVHKFLRISYKKGMMIYLLGFLVIIGIMGGVEKISQKSLETSTIITTSTEKLVGRNECGFPLEVYNDNLKGILVPFKVNHEVDSLNISIKNINTNETIANADYEASEIMHLDYISIDLEKYALAKGNTFYVTIKCAPNVYVMENEDIEGNIICTQIYEFSYLLMAKIMLFVLSFIVLFCAWLIRKKAVEIKITVFGLVVGIIVLCIIPPYSGSDEIRHFLRAYSLVTDTKIIQTTDYVGSGNGGVVDAASVPYGFSSLRLLDNGVDYNNQIYQAERTEKVFWDKFLQAFGNDYDNENANISMWGTLNITWINYVPQMLFIWIAELFSMPPVGILYMARFGNLLVSMLILYLAIRITPKTYKKLIAVMVFVPNIVNIRSTCSLDGLLFSCSVLFIAEVIRIRVKKVSIFKFKEIACLIGTLGWMALIKVPYILLAAMGLVFVKENFSVESNLIKKVEANKIIKYCCVCVCVGFCAVGLYGIRGVLLRGGSSILGQSHLNYMLQYPVRIIKMFADFMIIQTPLNILEGIALDGKLFVSLVFIVITVSVALNAKPLEQKNKIVIVLTLFLTCSSLFFVGYVINPCDLGKIQGIAGRYYLPLIPLFAMLLCYLPKDKIQLNKWHIDIFAIPLMMTFYVCSLFLHFWI